LPTSVHFRKHNEIDIYGTGGMILQNMKNLLECLPGLERLELVDLQLVGNDGKTHRVHIFTRDEAGHGVSAHSARACTATLLVMVNVTEGGGRAPPTLTSLG
jgi:hypothetical protein